MKRSQLAISAEEFDRRFDKGADISAHLDWDAALRPGLEPRRISLELPAWMVRDLDPAAECMGLSRQSVMKVWLAERLRSK